MTGKLVYRNVFPTYREALAAIPADAQWSSSFGNPGEDRYDEYWRGATGQRWLISKRGEYAIDCTYRAQFIVSAD